MISKIQTKNIVYGSLFLITAFLINSCSDLGNPVDPPGPDLPPTLDSIGSRVTLADDTLRIVVTATDDNSSVTLTTTTLPIEASFFDSGNGIGVFTWVPTLTDSVASISFFATDSAGQVASETITITIIGQTFDNYINPLFQTWCSESNACHGAFTASEFSVSDYSSVLDGGLNGTGIVPGQPESSVVFQKLSPTPPFGLRMPRFSTPFSDQRLDSIRLWILAGAPQN